MNKSLYEVRERTVFESNDSNVQSLTEALELHFKSANVTVIGTRLSPNHAYCYDIYYSGKSAGWTWPRDRVGRSKCLQTRENGIQTPFETLDGYMIKSVPRIHYEYISDFVGRLKDFTVHKWVPIKSYPNSRECRRQHRMGAVTNKCRRKITGRKLIHKTYRKRYRPPKGEVDMKPVTHVKVDRWVEGEPDVLIPNSSYHDPFVTITAVSLNDNQQSVPSPYYPITSFDHQWPGGDPRDFTPTSPVDLVDVYGAIAKGIPKIGGFTMDTESNLLVNLIQVRELMSLFSRRPLLLGPLGVISSLFLLTEFAIKPTIDDYITMRDMAVKLRRAIEHWNKNAGKVTYFHFSVLKDERLESEVTRSPIVNWTDTLRSSSKVSVNATIAIRGRKITTPDSVIKLSQLGINKPLGVLWELIPFSFVLDWFTDLSGFISQFETPASPARFDLVDACYSYKEERVDTVIPDMSRYSAKMPKIHQETSFYKRRLLNLDILKSRDFLDIYGSWEPSSRFGGKQALLSAALIAVLHPAMRR